MKSAQVLAGLLLMIGAGLARGEEVRIGMIGLDTSHVVAFTRLLTDASAADHVPGGRVVAAFRGGSADLESSRSRVDKFTQELEQKYGVRLYDTIGELCRNVDAVMLESVDGRVHLAQAIPVIEAGRPLFVDKPMAASLRDVLALFQLAEARGVPIFSSSSLRYGRETQAVRQGAIGRVLRAATTGPCTVDATHPELFWYGVHGVESLFTVMGTGCESVRRSTTAEGRIEVTGTWRGGRSGVYREDARYGGEAWGTTGHRAVGGNDGYGPLLREVVEFFKTGEAPVSAAETIELFAFMEASDESARRGGEPVRIEEVLRRNGHVREPAMRLVEVRRVWDEAPHNAFTDLTRFQDEWICVFREGASHVSPDGAIRVLVSTDGARWESAARLSLAGTDLRDPKVTVTTGGELMLTAAAAYGESSPVRHQTQAWFTGDAREWGEPLAIGEPDVWIWRVTWHEGTAYGIGYATVGERFARLYRSGDGRKFEVLVERLFEAGYPNEGSLGFEAGDTMVCLLRRDGAPGTAQVGWARPPYTEWTWKDLGLKIGGPHWIRVPDLPWVAGIRLYEPQARTVLAGVNIETGRMREWLTLPSGGDTSYAGLVWHDGRLWVSYYSSHEGRSSIYVAQVQFEESEAWRRMEAWFEPPAGQVDEGKDHEAWLKLGNGSAVESAEDWERRREEILETWHGVMGRWPALLERPRCEVLRSETRPSYVQHRVRIEIAPDRFEEGWLLVPFGSGPFPAVLVPFYEPDTSIGLGDREGRDVARQLAERGFVTLAIGAPGGDARRPEPGLEGWQPLSFLAYVAANCHVILAQRDEVDGERIGIYGHSYGGKWALFGACLYRPFACVAVSDPGIVWDESRPNVNYWEPWYLGAEAGATRSPGLVTRENPRTGAYRELYEGGRELQELHALLAPRPIFVAGGSEDPPERWDALQQLVLINARLGFEDRVGLSARAGHEPTVESNGQVLDFFEHFLGR